LGKLKLYLIIAVVFVAMLIGFLSLRSARPIVELKAETLSRIGHFAISLGPLPLFTDGYPISNTMVTAGVVIVLLIAFGYFATRKMSLVPTGIQNFFEMIVEALYNMVVGTAGEKHARRFFPVIATIFLYVVAANWFGLLPGVATIGKIEPFGGTQAAVVDKANVFNKVAGVNMILPGFPSWPPHEPDSLELNVTSTTTTQDIATQVQAQTKDLKSNQKAGELVPFLRSINTDLNATLALAIMSAIFVEFWGITSQGFFKYAGKFFNFKGGLIGFFVGILEFIAELARLLSFTFRLFGNIFAGEMLFLVILFLLPVIALDLVYGLELFVGLIQAFIFAMLTLVFGVIAVTSHEEGGDSHEHEPALPA
jgi:F-type H+-transporting ATPase subunit a